jgi:hypothetical protein
VVLAGGVLFVLGRTTTTHTRKKQGFHFKIQNSKSKIEKIGGGFFENNTVCTMHQSLSSSSYFIQQRTPQPRQNKIMVCQKSSAIAAPRL